MDVRGRGSIEQLDTTKEKYRCRKWRLWAHTEEGEKSKRITGTYKEAKDALDLFLSEIENDCVSRRIKFSKCAEDWYKNRVGTNNFSPNTLNFDRKNVKRLSEVFTKYYINQLNADIIQKTFNSMTRAGNVNQPLSGTYKSKLYDTLNLIFKWAIDREYIVRNPIDKVIKPKKDTKERKTLSKKEFDDLVKLLDAQPLDGRIMAIYMIMFLGLRRGEAVAVCWDDIDWKDRTVYIRHAFKSADRSVGDPKTEAGKRILPLPDKLYDKLKLWKKVVENELGETEYVCCNTLGNLLYTESLYDWWRSFLNRNSLSKIDLHELRHTNFTFIGRHASLFDLKHFAGWSTLEPAKRYVHNNQDMLRKAIDDAGL